MDASVTPAAAAPESPESAADDLLARYRRALARRAPWEAHWQQRNWRPLLMSVFGLIVFNNYVLAPYLQALVAVSVMLDIPPPMWELLKLGVGGYIVGRSAEKAVKAWRDGG